MAKSRKNQSRAIPLPPMSKKRVAPRTAMCPRAAAGTRRTLKRFPPRGICNLALERSTLVGASKGEKALLAQAKKILVHSPHPAFAVLHGYFSNETTQTINGQPVAVGTENSTLDSALKLVRHLAKKTKPWNDVRWRGPKVIDVTIYPAFKNEGIDYKNAGRGDEKLPAVLDPADDGTYPLYSARLDRIRAFIETIASEFPKSVEPWPKVTAETRAEDDVRVHVTVVPTLEDLRPDNYAKLARLCKKKCFGKFAHVSLRRNSESGDRSPLRRREDHPPNAEDGKIPDGFESGDVMTGDGGFWTETTDKAAIQAQNTAAFPSNPEQAKAIGVLLFEGQWQGRTGAGGPGAVDGRPYNTTRVKLWTELMSLGVRPARGQADFLIAATDWQRAGGAV